MNNTDHEQLISTMRTLGNFSESGANDRDNIKDQLIEQTDLMKNMVTMFEKFQSNLKIQSKSSQSDSGSVEVEKLRE